MPSSDATRKREHLEHLAQVRALSLAVASAISAIEKNDLRQFQIHLATQETICNRLSGTTWASLLAAPEKAAANDRLDTSLLHEVREAYKALAQLNRVYGALLKRTRRSFGLIIALYRSHGEGYDRVPSHLPQHHTWSCEV
jgi:hypothetical protein